jgi:hypothetical protein
MTSGSTLNFGKSVEIGGWDQRNSDRPRRTLVQGAGTVNVANTLTNNGRFVADGGNLQVNYGSLDTWHMGQLGDNTFPGWYATNAGKLTLPNLTITTGTTSKNWGETTGTTSFDVNSLVNSIRMTSMSGVTAGSLGISLLASTNGDVFFGLVDPVGIWKFAPTGGLSITSTDLTFRYDSLLAAAAESSLNLYQSSGSGWTLVTSSPTDMANHLMLGTGLAITGDLQYALAQSIAARSISTWTGAGGDANWDTGDNWGGTVPLADAALHFVGPDRTSPNNNLTAGISYGAIVFDATAPHFNVGGAGIALAGDITNSSDNDQTISLPIALAYSATTVDTGAKNVTLGGNLSNSGASTGGLVK